MSLMNTPEIKVNQVEISPAAIDAEMQYHPAPSRREAMIQAAQSLIIHQVLLQRAQALQLSISPCETLDQQQEGLIEALLAHEVDNPHASDQECLRYFEANREKFTTAPLVEVSHILISASPTDQQARAEAREIAENVHRNLVADGSNFAQMAADYSACPSKSVGGNLGQITKGQTVAEFERQVLAAQQGLMSNAIESRYGFHLVWVANKVKGRPLPYEQVEAQIRDYLNQKVQRKSVAQYIQHLLGEAEIEGFAFDLEASPLMQ